MTMTKYLVLTENLEVLGTMSGRDPQHAVEGAQKAYGIENILVTRDGAEEYIAQVMQAAPLRVEYGQNP